MSATGLIPISNYVINNKIFAEQYHYILKLIFDSIDIFTAFFYHFYNLILSGISMYTKNVGNLWSVMIIAVKILAL